MQIVSAWACHNGLTLAQRAVDKKSNEAAGFSSANIESRWGVFDFQRPQAGCRFAPRCPVFQANDQPAVCTDPASSPQLQKIGAAHQVRCHFPL